MRKIDKSFLLGERQLGFCWIIVKNIKSTQACSDILSSHLNGIIIVEECSRHLPVQSFCNPHVRVFFIWWFQNIFYFLKVIEVFVVIQWEKTWSYIPVIIEPWQLTTWETWSSLEPVDIGSYRYISFVDIDSSIRIAITQRIFKRTSLQIHVIFDFWVNKAGFIIFLFIATLLKPVL